MILFRFLFVVCFLVGSSSTNKALTATRELNINNFEEMVALKVQEDEDERELMKMFRELDKEKRGEVNTSELRWILKGLGDDLSEEDIDEMIADVNTDGSGWVNFEEFKALMTE